MWVMFDSVTLDEIPASASAVAGYVGGAWPTFGEAVKRWPHAQHLSIAVNASEGAQCLDVERGDATPADAPAWYHRQRTRGVRRPVFYASQSMVAEVVGELKRVGISRSEYGIWSAHYTFTPHICGPHEGVDWAADATQWTNRALGRNLDESLCVSSFFTPTQHRSPLSVLLPHELDALRNRSRAHLVVLRKAVWLAATHGRTPRGGVVPPGWDIRHRRERYRLLWERTR